MKKSFCFFIFLLFLFLPLPAFASNEPPSFQKASYSVVVNGEPLTSICLIQNEAHCVFVPLRPISTLLGYTVTWDPQSKTASVEDSIQKAQIIPDNSTISFLGKLQIIDLSHELYTPACPILYHGQLYVPVSFFHEFFNDIIFTESSITIAPQIVEIQTKI